jgi:glycerol-1-phosphate dehydrogenase [NAD(P)+]
MEFTGQLFPTVYGRNLIGELKNFIHRPYLVVTMKDLWPKFESLFDKNLAGVYFVDSLEFDDLCKDQAKLPKYKCIVGLGGGQAIDVAKFFIWNGERVPLFTVPTVMSVNAGFGHRTAVRFGSQVRYIGWAVPEAVYVDFDVIQQAPKGLNWSGVGDIFCYHTGMYDWKFADERGKTEPQWPYDAGLVSQAKSVLDTVLAAVDDIHAVNENGIRTLMNAHRWGGGTFHNAGWNCRHIEGYDHLFFYCLEYYTHKHFIHGQPVCLGTYIGASLQQNEPEKILDAIRRVGVDIRPEAMGVTWDDVAHAIRRMPEYTKEAGLLYTSANEIPATEKFIEECRQHIYQAY